jgi:DNA-binding transcriptional ArsR family regulator
MVELAEALSLKAKLFRGFADPSRLAILEALRGGALSVGEIIEVTGLTQSNASNHLGCLLGCGLVLREPRGRYVYYRLRDAQVEEVLGLGDALLAEVAGGVETCAGYEPQSH